MTILGVISEALLYLCFAILMGTFLLHVIPSSVRPRIQVSKQYILFSILGIAILSFFPVLQIVLVLYEEIGLGLTMRSVLYTFEVGKAWIVTFILANIMIIYIVYFDYEKKSNYAYGGIIFTILLIITLGWSSHASSLSDGSGFIAHSIHFLSVSVWAGILFVVSWFSSTKDNWLKFLKWFSPLVIACLLAIVGTGLFIMSLVVDFKDYTNAWMVSYGQALLLKHLLILPLLVFAFINSFLIRKKLQKDIQFDPRTWTKAESVILLLLFAATAALGQQSPPHDLVTTLKSVGVSKLFDLVYQNNIQADMTVLLQFGLNSALFGALSVLFFIITILVYLKKAPALLGFITSILFVLTTYLALMLSVV